ncbi:unnamed protein product [Moneuplotes crassus]|uniref:BZIP domain-containing protein n=1 Tax=Euplotes crassus TaxID=5936 RepID=A0AAD2D1K6_EUPCR|nr:unnamed protein product [Moneuplotes crassus]
MEAHPPKARKRKTNSERSREFRKRKKAFVQDKIKQVEALEEEVKELRKENSEMKEMIRMLEGRKVGGGSKGVSGHAGNIQKRTFDNTLQEYEDYFYNSLSKKLQSNPDEVRFSMIEQTFEHVYDWSDDRISFIKKCFKDILDNMLSLETKCYQTCLKNFPLSSFVKNQRNKRRHKKYFQKSTDNLTPKEISTNIQLRDEVIDFVDKNSKYFHNWMKQARKIAKELIILRNNLLNSYQSQKKVFESSGYSNWFKKSDLINTLKLVDQLKNTKFLTPHYLYNIPPKTHSNPKYEEGELTE